MPSILPKSKGKPDLHPVLEQILRTGTVTKPDGGTIPLHSNISREQGLFVQDIIEQMGAQRTIEIGFAYGISAMFICAALIKQANARHIIIDPSQESRWDNIGLYNLQQAGYEDIFEHHAQQSFRVLPRLLEEGSEFDFAFIDGVHSFDFVLIDFFFIDRMLRVGGVVVLDDLNLPAIRRVCRYFATNRNYRVLRCQPASVADQIKRRLVDPFIYAARGSQMPLCTPFSPSDRALGLLPGSRCIAFEKTDEDYREWDFHRDF